MLTACSLAALQLKLEEANMQNTKSFNTGSVWHTFQARAGEFASSLKGSILRLLLDAGFLFLLRFSLDDAVDNVMAASVGALRALLVSLDDEVRKNH